ncbi:MAG: nucleotidyltransferase family protein [Candidatus Gottesmanbacteria bacterium]|nr:nucleotidyltransferase family protein [Candidatus Gottesmanbacteria bacterium]
MDIQAIKQKTTELFKQYKVRKAALFGSIARGEAGSASSDIDILVEMGEGRALDFFGLQEELSERFGRHVDLVEYVALRPEFKDGILADAVTMYEAKL